MPKMTKSGCFTETAKMTYHTKLMFELECGKILAFITIMMGITAQFRAKHDFKLGGAFALKLIVWH